MVSVLSTLLLLAAILLFGGTIATVFKRVCLQPSRVDQIRRWRQEGVAVKQEGEVG